MEQSSSDLSHVAVIDYTVCSVLEIFLPSCWNDKQN